MATEIELKLEIGPEQILTLKNHPLLVTLVPSVTELENVYYDSDDHQLATKKMGLRTRYDGQSWCQTLKSKGEAVDGLHLRDEWETPISGNALEINQLAEAGCNRQMIEWLTSLDLAPLFTTRFTRHCWNLVDEQTAIELVLDLGEVTAGNNSTSISEIELELKRGDITALQTVARQLRAAIPLTPSDISKAARGYQLLAD